MDDNPKGCPPASVDKIRKILTFLVAIEDVDELRTIPVWSAHRLVGDRKGSWSLNVTRNWRLTFSVNHVNEVCDVDLEDYH